MEISPRLHPGARAAQVVLPYDPNAVPAPVTATSKNSYAPFIGLALATVIVIALIIFVARRHAHKR